jgi:diguanylate cyclase (GGDEF)-like protein/PAS domain S-box-containing protein
MLVNPPAKPTLSRERALHTYTLSLWIELAGIFLIALLWFATVRMVQQDYDDELQAAFRTQATLARAMDLQVQEVLNDADGVLLAMKQSQETRGNITVELRQALEMSNLAKFTAQASILDPRGNFRFSFRPVQSHVNLADRAQFQAHVERDTGTFYISPLVQGRVSGLPSFHISRRINNPDGLFGGVVSLALQARYFTEIFSKITREPRTFFLLGRDGQIRATDEKFGDMLGRSLKESPLFEKIKIDPLQGEYVGIGSLTQQSRIISYRAVGTYPLYVTVSIEEKVAMERHRLRRNIYFGTAGLTSLLLIGLLAGLYRSQKKQERLAHSIVKEKEKAESYLNMADALIVAVDASGRITLVNHKGCEILDYPESELIGQNWLEVLALPEHREKAAEVFGRFVAGKSGPLMKNANFRVRDRQGNVHVLDLSSRLMYDEQGVISGTLSSGADVTQRRQLEEELKILATTDFLTGLSNRRHFLGAAVLAMESFRRYHRPLALLTLDIDHFKKINDTYGHATGDQVLVAVADTLRSVLRSADLCGRFGGEEFVCLLPETTETEARIVAERLRRSLAEQSVAAAEGTVRFTASIGLTVADIGDVSVESLLQRADAAMYEAKKAGRNRVVSC